MKQSDSAVASQVNYRARTYYQLAGSLGAGKGGRPTKYHDELCELVMRMYADPEIVCSISFIAATLSISRDTLYRWQHTKPQFSDSLAWGKAIQEAQLATCAALQPQDNKGTITLLKVLHSWSDKPVHKREKIDVAKIIDEAESIPTVDWDRQCAFKSQSESDFRASMN